MNQSVRIQLPSAKDGEGFVVEWLLLNSFNLFLKVIFGKGCSTPLTEQS